jgi:hypothetical protein
MDIALNVAMFVAGLLCGMLVVGPKLVSAVTGILNEMRRDLNPRRDIPLADPAHEPPSPIWDRSLRPSR